MILVSIFSLRNKNAFRLSSFFYPHFKKFGFFLNPSFCSFKFFDEFFPSIK
ncbi:hypothetical protein LEP1GSC016_4117 [Leptospira borgpetersenii serovar Hardjo-bovis str. Sponselee]|uniref:Uncharacterized protein n=1 Tax=Leptospira borgpetersenii serovar Hardjo-bovis str. Sponselee TaxID=1303729 RepID=M6BYS5_LEPBO|nr:hypothetical protein LEP1GSC016_4117 [Leptospira borgpetersenii serovar Hardjo-bovis str. Sponselee]